MATVDDVEVANASFPNVRQDLNDILEAITTNFSADTEPTTTYPNQFWYETDTNLLYIRNEADDAWITLASINQTTGEWEPRTAVIQAIDSAGIALKTDEGTTRFSISDAGVVSFENYAFPSADGTAGQVLSTDGSGTLTFEDAGAGDKIEEGNSSVEVVDTGTGHVAVTVDGSETARFDANGRLGIGTNSPDEKLSVVASNPFLELQGTSTSSGDTGIFLNANANHWILKADNFTNTNAFQIKQGDTSSSTAYLTLDSSANLQFNSGFGSVATAYGCRAWVMFNGTGTVAIFEDGNVSSITDNGTGDYTVNFTTAMPDGNYAVFVSAREDFSGNTSGQTFGQLARFGQTTSATRVYSRVAGSGLIDSTQMNVSIFR